MIKVTGGGGGDDDDDDGDDDDGKLEEQQEEDMCPITSGGNSVSGFPGAYTKAASNVAASKIP